MPPEDDILEGLTVDEDSLLSDLTTEPEGASIEAAAEYARTPAPRTLSTPFADKPWYEQLSDSVGDSPGLSFLENAGNSLLSGFGDEAQAGALVGNREMLGPERVQGYQGIPADSEGGNTYGAGSRFEDTRQTLATERQERNEKNPISSTTGAMAGGALQAAAVPAATLPQALGTGTALVGAQLVGEGSGDIGERVEQAGEQIAENPVSTALAVGAPAVGAGAAKGLSAVSNALANRAGRNTVAAFTTPMQRAAIAENKGGQAAVDTLGKDVRALGLHKEPWYNFWKPGFSAETLQNNASKARVAAHEGMEAAENEIVQAGNPQIAVGHIADDLDASAAEVMKRASVEAPSDAATRTAQAARLRKVTEVTPEGPPQMIQPEARSPEFWFEGDSPAPVGREVPLEPVATGQLPFSQALEDRRYFDQQVNHLRRGGHKGAGTEEQVQRQVANQLRGALDEGLEGAVQRGELPPEPVDAWKTHKKNYATAAAVDDPSLAKMQSEYGGSMGLKDLAGASLLSAAGVPGLAAAGGAKAMQGRWPGAIANTQASLSENAAALGRTAGPAAGAARVALTPIEQARQENPEAPQVEVEAAANKSLKEELTETLLEATESTKDWFSGLLD